MVHVTHVQELHRVRNVRISDKTIIRLWASAANERRQAWQDHDPTDRPKRLLLEGLYNGVAVTASLLRTRRYQLQTCREFEIDDWDAVG